jgi:hypothetical protein
MISFIVIAAVLTIAAHAHQIAISGFVPLRMEIKDGLLFCNSSTGCVVRVGDRVILESEGPVFDEPVDYRLAPDEFFKIEKR